MNHDYKYSVNGNNINPKLELPTFRLINTLLYYDINNTGKFCVYNMYKLITIAIIILDVKKIFFDSVPPT